MNHEFIIACPVTGEEIATGKYILAGKKGDTPQPLAINNTTFCPTCKREHVWDISDTTTREAPEVE